MHTVWSDGGSTITEMAKAAIERGYEYIAVTDHSKGLRIAGGINEAQLEQQAEEIRSLSASPAAAGKKFRVLRSIELNLNPQGGGDMSSESLNKLDIVLGCFHSALRKTEDQTNRYLAALRNPHVHILGHPRGRVYNFRLGLIATWPAIFEEAAEFDKAVEINWYPDPPGLKSRSRSACRESGLSRFAWNRFPWRLAARFHGDQRGFCALRQAET
jgi:histidinol phosphatase-like PHP family hydrolase